jgi:tryptophan-rich sensory protein
MSIELGLLDISLMLAFIIWSVFLFAPISRVASWLMVPYAVWVSYAWFLNAGIFILN